MCLSKSETIGLVNDQGAVEAVIQFDDILRCVRAICPCVCMCVHVHACTFFNARSLSSDNTC